MYTMTLFIKTKNQAFDGCSIKPEYIHTLKYYLAIKMK